MQQQMKLHVDDEVLVWIDGSSHASFPSRLASFVGGCSLDHEKFCILP